MGTRCVIARVNQDGSCEANICAHDGYPDGVGIKLMAHYSNEPELSALLGLEPISSLGNSPEDPLNWTDMGHLMPVDGQELQQRIQTLEDRCVVFPDRQYGHIPRMNADSTEELLQKAAAHGYDHVYLRAHGRWTVGRKPHYHQRPLEEVVRIG